MIPSDFILPIGPVPSLRHTSWKPPWNHEQSSSEVILPPGPIGPGFISASPFHFPAKASSFLTSGPGLGASSCWGRARIVPAARHAPARTAAIVRTFMCPPLSFECGDSTPPKPIGSFLAGLLRRLRRGPRADLGRLALEDRRPRAAFRRRLVLENVLLRRLLGDDVPGRDGPAFALRLARERPGLSLDPASPLDGHSEAVDRVLRVRALRRVVTEDPEAPGLPRRPLAERAADQVEAPLEPLAVVGRRHADGRVRRGPHLGLA